MLIDKEYHTKQTFGTFVYKTISSLLRRINIPEIIVHMIKILSVDEKWRDKFSDPILFMDPNQRKNKHRIGSHFEYIVHIFYQDELLDMTICGVRVT